MGSVWKPNRWTDRTVGLRRRAGGWGSGSGSVRPGWPRRRRGSRPRGLARRGDRGGQGQRIHWPGWDRSDPCDRGGVARAPGRGGGDDDVTLVLAPAARSPRAKVKTPATGVTPPVAETKVAPDGNVSVRVTPVAGAVPCWSPSACRSRLAPTSPSRGPCRRASGRAVGRSRQRGSTTWPILLPSNSVNQRLPSGPTVIRRDRCRPWGPGTR